MQVYPVINCENFECVKERLGMAEILFSSEGGSVSGGKNSAPEDRWVHIDIADGQFVPAHSWDNVEEFAELAGNNPQINFEVHLMVKNPEGVIDSYLRAGAKRIVVQLESMADSVYILEKCQKYGAEAMLSLMPPTEAERLLAFKDDFKYFQVLAVSHGYSGQVFQPEVLKKVEFLRKNISNAIIEVDGGINPETAKQAKDAGADIVVSGAFVFNGENSENAYQILKST